MRTRATGVVEAAAASAALTAPSPDQDAPDAETVANLQPFVRLQTSWPPDATAVLDAAANAYVPQLEPVASEGDGSTVGSGAASGVAPAVGSEKAAEVIRSALDNIELALQVLCIKLLLGYLI